MTAKQDNAYQTGKAEVNKDFGSENSADGVPSETLDNIRNTDWSLPPAEPQGEFHDPTSGKYTQPDDVTATIITSPAMEVDKYHRARDEVKKRKLLNYMGRNDLTVEDMATHNPDVMYSTDELAYTIITALNEKDLEPTEREARLKETMDKVGLDYVKLHKQMNSVNRLGNGSVATILDIAQFIGSDVPKESYTDEPSFHNGFLMTQSAISSLANKMGFSDVVSPELVANMQEINDKDTQLSTKLYEAYSQGTDYATSIGKALPAMATGSVAGIASRSLIPAIASETAVNYARVIDDDYTLNDFIIDSALTALPAVAPKASAQFISGERNLNGGDTYLPKLKEDAHVATINKAKEIGVDLREVDTIADDAVFARQVSGETSAKARETAEKLRRDGITMETEADIINDIRALHPDADLKDIKFNADYLSNLYKISKTEAKKILAHSHIQKIARTSKDGKEFVSNILSIPNKEAKELGIDSLQNVLKTVQRRYNVAKDDKALSALTGALKHIMTNPVTGSLRLFGAVLKNAGMALDSIVTTKGSKLSGKPPTRFMKLRGKEYDITGFSDEQIEALQKIGGQNATD
ncbi:MAG: hypothetical protein DRQ24_12320 [Candidatus Latescibacterota bacterium]|nr:MAG: hypothetical protein DRQ24_12320 [Candidatus Latescibacterota bacterium]